MKHRLLIRAICATAAIAWLWPIGRARAADIQADSSNYKDKITSLQPGDRLILAAGTYQHFTIRNLNGDQDHWITITGPDQGQATIQADTGPCCNTIEIVDSSYVSIENLIIDGLDVGGAFGVSAKDGTSNHVHHIRIEGCTFVHHDAGQQTDAISTKTPTWGWIIRGNKIIGAGTGIYLGNSNGDDPFVAGIIEYNLIEDPLGYCMEIKWQQPWPQVDGMPTGPTSTIIRHNVFIKSDRPSPSGDRPNILVGGFPSDGPGSQNMYEIYGNFFYHNPRESLIQVSGRVSIHDNIFVDVVGTAIRLQNHDLPMRLAWIYNNTIYSAGQGIHVGGTLDQGASVVGNLIFADTPISGTAPDQRDNMTDSVDAAANDVVNPSITLGQMDFYPLAGQCQDSAIDLSTFAQNTDFDRDFNGTDKAGRTFRGAYAGEGTNPGWPLDDGIKDETTQGPDGGTNADGDTVADGGPDAGSTGDGATNQDGTTGDGSATNSHGSSSGCSCRNTGGVPNPGLIMLLMAAMFLIRRRRRAA
ncbi:MAG: hypothetical protein J7M25_13660 [Deltaproteobacteria bacterium]|nr:hypothetical protein [Deltaproteobacteria bacterium]